MSTKPHVTQLVWHTLKAFGFTQQINSPCSLFPSLNCPSLPFQTPVLCIHYPVFILAKDFSISSKAVFWFPGNTRAYHVSPCSFRTNPSCGRTSWKCSVSHSLYKLKPPHIPASCQSGSLKSSEEVRVKFYYRIQRRGHENI